MIPLANADILFWKSQFSPLIWSQSGLQDKQFVRYIGLKKSRF